MPASAPARLLATRKTQSDRSKSAHALKYAPLISNKIEIPRSLVSKSKKRKEDFFELVSILDEISNIIRLDEILMSSKFENFVTENFDYYYSVFFTNPHNVRGGSPFHTASASRSSSSSSIISSSDLSSITRSSSVASVASVPKNKVKSFVKVLMQYILVIVFFVLSTRYMFSLIDRIPTGIKFHVPDISTYVCKNEALFSEKASKVNFELAKTIVKVTTDFTEDNTKELIKKALSAYSPCAASTRLTSAIVSESSTLANYAQFAVILTLVSRAWQIMCGKGRVPFFTPKDFVFSGPFIVGYLSSFLTFKNLVNLDTYIFMYSVVYPRLCEVYYEKFGHKMPQGALSNSTNATMFALPPANSTLTTDHPKNRRTWW